MIRKTISTSRPATKLIELAQRLSAKENYQLARRIMAGERVIVFNVDGERVTLASEQAHGWCGHCHNAPGIHDGYSVDMAETEPVQA
jgi:hypothetical protein